MELTPPLSWLGRTLQELQIRRNHDVQILLVHDCGSTGGTVLPDGNHRFAPTSAWSCWGRQAALERLRTMA
jgi:Trk K+ transport system NAD-binding subunit